MTSCFRRDILPITTSIPTRRRFRHKICRVYPEKEVGLLQTSWGATHHRCRRLESSLKGKRGTRSYMPTNKLTPEIINAAVEGFEQQKLRIDAQIAELRAMFHGGPTATAATPELPKGKRRKMSAAVRKRMGDAQRKRWAESKKSSEPSSPVAPEVPKPKRKLSA